MPQGVLTEYLPMTRHQGRRDDQTSHEGKRLNDMRKSGQWHQTGGSDRATLVRHLEFLRLLVQSGELEV